MNKFLGQVSRPMWISATVGAVIGVLIGLVLGWGVWPVQWVNAGPGDLADYWQQDYLAAAVQSYARNPDQKLAQQRWKDLGEKAPTVLSEVTANAAALGITPDEIAVYTAVAQGTPVVDGTDKPAPTGLLTPVLLGFCGLLLFIGALLVYLLFFRNRRPSITRGKSGGNAPLGDGDVAADGEEGDGGTIAKYLTTYTIGNDLYDDSFSIDSAAGEFLGECGVGIAETIGVGDPKKITAFEVWLFDKNDIQTVTKVIMSEHAFNDQAISQRLASKGEPVLAEHGKRILLETATLQLEAHLVNMAYGQGALPPNSFFDQVTLELSIWHKE